jgi:phage tail tape-measure protein
MLGTRGGLRESGGAARPAEDGEGRVATLRRSGHTGGGAILEVGPVASEFEDKAVQAGGTAGTLAGAISGAKLLGGVVPIPFVGPVVGAVVGGVVGSELGRRLGKAVINGGTAFVQTLTSSTS